MYKRPKEQIKKHNATRYTKYKDKLNLESKIYYNKNKESVKAKQKEYRQKNKQYFLLRNRARALKLISKISKEDINNLVLNSNNICYYCKKNIDKMHIDHYIPLALNGRHHIDNLVVSCSTCNLSKGKKMPETFILSLNNSNK